MTFQARTLPLRNTLLLVSMCVASVTSAAGLTQIDWGAIAPGNVVLFSPGQSSYEWVRSTIHRAAHHDVKRGESCAFCHDEEDAEKEIGIVNSKGGRLEPYPITGKTGFIDLGVQAAFDAQNVYLRFQWKTNSPKPGPEHRYVRFDGKEWKPWGFSRLDGQVREGQAQPLVEDRISLMLDDGKVADFAKQGCWLTCHDGMRDMPPQFSSSGGTVNTGVPPIGQDAIRKYLPDSRHDPSDWKSRKAPKKIARLKADGKFLELMQWRARSSSNVSPVEDGYVLDWGYVHTKNEKSDSNIGKNQLPRFMWDQKVAGFRSVRDDSAVQNNKLPLMRGQNAVPFDPRVRWQVGDMLPDRVVSPRASKDITGTRATGSWSDGVWTVVITRPLRPTGTGSKALAEGSVYNVGFAVHDDNVGTRAHHVSFVKTLGLGVKADIQAVKVP